MSAPASIASTPNWRADFPALDQSVHKQPLVYLDSAASAQQPAAVIDAVADYQRRDHANVHRGVHYLSQVATEVYEGARLKLQAMSLEIDELTDEQKDYLASWDHG